MKRKFRFNWKVTVFSVLCFTGFVHLGLWQLEREVEKRELLARAEERLSIPPIEAHELSETGDLQGLPVRLVGKFREPVLFLDNKVLNGQVGFEAHQLFHDETGLLFLVNRGFVQMGRTRDDELILSKVHNKPADILGRIYQPGSQMVLLHNEERLIPDFPAIVQQIDIDKLIATLGQPLYPFVIRLEAGEFGALPRYWPSTVMSPEKHRGYAIQWFTMALAVLIAWLFFSFSKDSQHE